MNQSESLTLTASLVSVYDTGVLIEGPPGCGKTDTILTLIARHHQFIADDGVQLYTSEQGLAGTAANPLTHDFIHVKGIGIINLQQILGKEQLKASAIVELIIRLTPEEDIETNDALSPYSEQPLLGHQLTQLTISYCLNRPLALLIETAVKSFLLSKKGYNPADEFDQQQQQQLSNH